MVKVCRLNIYEHLYNIRDKMGDVVLVLINIKLLGPGGGCIFWHEVFQLFLGHLTTFY